MGQFSCQPKQTLEEWDSILVHLRGYYFGFLLVTKLQNYHGLIYHCCHGCTSYFPVRTGFTLEGIGLFVEFLPKQLHANI